jgi:hypothetical protein
MAKKNSVRCKVYVYYQKNPRQACRLISVLCNAVTGMNGCLISCLLRIKSTLQNWNEYLNSRQACLSFLLLRCIVRIWGRFRPNQQSWPRQLCTWFPFKPVWIDLISVLCNAVTGMNGCLISCLLRIKSTLQNQSWPRQLCTWFPFKHPPPSSRLNQTYDVVRRVSLDVAKIAGSVWIDLISVLCNAVTGMNGCLISCLLFSSESDIWCGS